MMNTDSTQFSRKMDVRIGPATILQFSSFVMWSVLGTPRMITEQFLRLSSQTSLREELVESNTMVSSCTPQTDGTSTLCNFCWQSGWSIVLLTARFSDFTGSLAFLLNLNFDFGCEVSPMSMIFD